MVDSPVWFFESVPLLIEFCSVNVLCSDYTHTRFWKETPIWRIMGAEAESEEHVNEVKILNGTIDLVNWIESVVCFYSYKYHFRLEAEN